MSDTRGLADELFDRVLTHQPFLATSLGVSGYDDRVTDVSAAAQQQAATELRELAARGEALTPDSPDEAITRDCILHMASSGIAATEAAIIDYTVGHVTDGPALVFYVASNTHPATPQAAADYLARAAGFADYLDGCIERLRGGAAAGKLPVASLVDVVRGQVDAYLGGNADPVAGVEPPAGWDGADAWRQQLADICRDVVRPAFARYRELLDELAPRSRGDEQCGLVHVDGGAESYAKLVHVHTTLDLTAEQVHAIGLEAAEALREEMLALGAELGLTSYDVLQAAARAASTGSDAQQAMAGAREAVRRAEERVPDFFAPPYPPPCRVEAMNEHLAKAGMAPHYTPPSADGAREGTYWFNAEVPGLGAGWDRETTAYHEAVPGHHLQVARVAGMSDLPMLQSHGFVTAYLEGWGLYAELLADEMGLYTSTEQRIGALAMRLLRAGRLVVDTGMHALGWSKSRAVGFFRDWMIVPEQFAESEINRYICAPGQALAYYIGLREILLLREQARERLGDRFTPAGFHSAVLDAGTLPLPALATAVDSWVSAPAG
ncbi:MAG TPA: DUF885 domain-containing protein [Mycobacteriales bacterium]|nr:DUF885 domain-containing protein [Mycobacteriales bacterium]